jgi:hypothetical protein
VSGRLWPIHLKPYVDELLSSWVVRLSRAYGTDARRFCASVWPRAAWSRDIDTGSYVDVLEVLSDKTATPRARVCETTFGGYRGFPAQELTRHGRSPWLLRTGERTSQRHRAGVSYCPACLQEDEEPYFRRPWRLTCVTVCPHHCCQLLDRCAACAAPCTLYHVPGNAAAITCCSCCQFDARQAQAPAWPRRADHRRVLQFQTALVDALHYGWYPLVPTASVATAEYLAVLRHLGRLVITQQRAHELRRECSGPLDAPADVPFLLSSSGRAIEALSVTDRFALMQVLEWWLEQWPERFVTMCAMAQLTRTDLSGGFRDAPDWYAAAVAQVAQHRLAGMKWSQVARRVS